MMQDLIEKELAGLKFIYNSDSDCNDLRIEPNFSGDIEHKARDDVDFDFYRAGSLVVNNRVPDLRIELIKTISDEGYCCELFNNVYDFMRGTVFKVKLVDGENIQLTTPQKCLLLALGYVVKSLEMEEAIKDGGCGELLYNEEGIQTSKTQGFKFYSYYCLSVDKYNNRSYNGKFGTLNRIRVPREFNQKFIDDFLATRTNGLRKNTNVDDFVREKLIPSLKRAWQEQHKKREKDDTENTMWSKQKATKEELSYLKFYVSRYIEYKLNAKNSKKTKS